MTRSSRVFASYDLIVTPTLAAMPVAEPRRRQHHRPERGQRRGGRPADRLVPDLSDQLHRPSRSIDPRRRGRRPAGRHADHRPPLRRRRRARRERRVRGAPAVGGALSGVRGAGAGLGHRTPADQASRRGTRRPAPARQCLVDAAPRHSDGSGGGAAAEGLGERPAFEERHHCRPEKRIAGADRIDELAGNAG